MANVERNLDPQQMLEMLKSKGYNVEERLLPVAES